jgi:hypothetical protein
MYLRVIERKKTLRVDLTRINVESTRSTVQLKYIAACWFNTQIFFLITRIRVESTVVWLNENKNNNQKKQKAHDGTCWSKFYVYYDVFKVIFWMLMLRFKLMILGLWFMQ